MTNLTRRGLLGALICAPAIVRASSLMALPHPVRKYSEQEMLALLDKVLLYTQEKMIEQINTSLYSGYENLVVQTLKERPQLIAESALTQKLQFKPEAVYSTGPKWQL